MRSSYPLHYATTCTTAVLLLLSGGAASYAQIAPSESAEPPKTESRGSISAPSNQGQLKPGWVAELLSANTNVNNVIGEVPLASFIFPPNRADAYSYVSKKALPRALYAFRLKGLFNVSESGSYGFSLQFDNLFQATCGYTFSIDDQPVISADYRQFTSFSPHADKSIELTAAMHPASLQVVCIATNGPNYLNYDKLTVSLKMKAPSDDEVTLIPSDFVVHKVRKSGD